MKNNTLSLDQDYPRIAESEAWLKRADGLIPAWTQTLAKGPQMHVRGVAPVYLRRGKGSHVWDVDGNEYLDMTMAVGPLPLGYAHPEVDAAIAAQLADGITFSLMHPLEVEVAELVRAVVPSAEMVRYSKTGADVCSAAIRLARAHTGKRKVLCCGYHGWHDWYASTMPLRAGIPSEVQDLTHTFPYNDLAAVEASIDDDTAAIILEPMTFMLPERGFLQGLRELATRRGVVLIFDEMWTGFRFALGGAQERFGVTPDLAVFSKAVANGMPLALLTGQAEIMQHCDGDIFFYTTFGGEALSLAAAKTTIEVLRRDRVPDALRRKGAVVKDGFAQLTQKIGIPWAKCVGEECRTMVQIDDSNGSSSAAIKTFVQQELVKRGVLWNGFHNLSAAHSDADLEHLLAAYGAVLSLAADAVDKRRVESLLRGPVLAPMLRRVSGFDTKPKTP